MELIECRTVLSAKGSGRRGHGHGNPQRVKYVLPFSFKDREVI